MFGIKELENDLRGLEARVEGELPGLKARVNALELIARADVARAKADLTSAEARVSKLEAALRQLEAVAKDLANSPELKVAIAAAVAAL